MNHNLYLAYGKTKSLLTLRENEQKMTIDNEILQELSKKNQAVFDALYKEYYKKLFVLSFKYIRNQELAEEVVHDVFLKIWNQSDSLQITQSLSSYLSKAVVNTSLTMLKSQKRELENYTRYEVEFSNDTDDHDEAELLEKKLLKIEQAISQLPVQCKKVFLMSKYEKLKQQEISGRLNISIKTVKNHLTYAFKKIRETIGENRIIIMALIFIQLMHRTF